MGVGGCLGEEGWRTGGQYWTFKYDIHFERSIDRLMFESGVWGRGSVKDLFENH